MSISREKLYLYAISLALSLLLWTQVNIQSEQVKEKEFTVPIEYRQSGLTQFPVTSTDLVGVIISGKSNQVDRIESKDVRIYANLANKKLGEHLIKLLVEPLPDGIDIKLKRQEVSVSLEELMTTNRQVEIDPVGTAPPELVFERAVAIPASVSISGPKSQIDKIRKLRAVFDLSTVRLGVSQEQKLEALDRNGEPVSMLKFEPNRVEVSPVAASGPLAKNVLVVAKFKGQPAFGYSIKGYELSLTTIQLKGSNDRLKGVQTIETETIDLTGIKADKTFEVRLTLPNGLSFGPGIENKVKAFVRVVRSEGAGQ